MRNFIYSAIRTSDFTKRNPFICISEPFHSSHFSKPIGRDCLTKMHRCPNSDKVHSKNVARREFESIFRYLFHGIHMKQKLPNRKNKFFFLIIMQNRRTSEIFTIYYVIGLY
jgi:hypothetical protein